MNQTRKQKKSLKKRYLYFLKTIFRGICDFLILNYIRTSFTKGTTEKGTKTMGAKLEKEQGTKKGTELCKSEISKKEPNKYLVFYYRYNIEI